LKNTSYKLIFSNKSDKYLKNLKKDNNEDFNNLISKTILITKNPYDSKSLKGKFKGLKRVEYRSYRIVFYIENKTNPPEIQILDIGLRKNVYK
jgi:mRNA-degrading endonuclease RelE of RelBE toxin-antitoxin system